MSIEKLKTLQPLYVAGFLFEAGGTRQCPDIRLPQGLTVTVSPHGS